MSRLPLASFAALIVATVAAFFIVQHLKVSTPLIAGSPVPFPGVINPVSGRTCTVIAPDGKRVSVSFRRSKVSFYLLNRADDVDVWVIDPGGAIVRTLAIDRYMGIKKRIPFIWNGREDSGTLAPNGTYYIRVTLVHQNRTVKISGDSGPEPVKIKTFPPSPVVQSVSPELASPDPKESITIRYAGSESRAVTIEIYRTDLPGRPRLVKSFVTAFGSQTAVWDGLINHRPAPTGTYLVGITMTDAACNLGTFPKTIPPAPGTTPHAGLTVEYLAAQPPMAPVAAGSEAAVEVYSVRRSYRWSLVRAGAQRPAVTGVGFVAGALRPSTLRIPVPSGRAGLYELELQAGPYRTTVPLVANASRPATALVVLPALAWQGLNPVDDTGDGLPSTLAGGGPIELERPLLDGLPAGYGDEAGLLAYLDSTHRAYDLTTDLGLALGAGPALAGHSLVVLAGIEEWLPSSLAPALRAYVEQGGHLVSFGPGSLLRTATVAGGRALDPSPPAAVDVLGFRPAAGAARHTLGRGTFAAVDIAGFGSSLRHDSSARALIRRLWTAPAH